MPRLACARLRCRDSEYFYFDADGVRRYTSAIVWGSLGEHMCGSTNNGWFEEVYSFHQKFSHTADELALKVRARSVPRGARVCWRLCLPLCTYVFSCGARGIVDQQYRAARKPSTRRARAHSCVFVCL